MVNLKSIMEKFLNNFCKFISTGAYCGYIKFAPGTFGTIVGFFITIILWLFFPYNLIIYFLLWLCLFVLGVFCVQRFEKVHGIHDPSCVVIDEIAGYLLIFVFIDHTNLNIISFLLAFLLFRFFDILKPMPINLVEKKLNGKSLGTMLDDVLAGVFSLILINLFYYYF